MAKIKLTAIEDGNDKNRYCGPSVISALTNLTTGEAARLIRKQSGRTAIKGTQPHEVLEALRACNIKAHRSRYLSRPTLAGWLRMSKADRTSGRVFLIVAGHHWQLVSGRRYTCGRIREIVSIKDKRVKRRARVTEVYEVTSDNVTMPDLDVSKPKPKKQDASDRAKAQRLAKKIGAEIDVEYHVDTGEGNLYWVYPPEGLFDDDTFLTPDGRADPYEGCRCCYHWDGVIGVVLDYQDIVAGHNVSWTESNHIRPSQQPRTSN